MKTTRIAKTTLFAAPAFALALMAQSAQATIIVTNTGASPACSTSEVTLGSKNSDYCAGYFNLANSEPATETGKLNDVTDGADWTFIYKIEENNVTEGPGVFGGISLTLSNVSIGAVTGVWTISWADTNGALDYNLPLYIDLAVGFKAATGIGYFMFDDFLLTNNPYSSTGSFDLIVDRALSHESLFVRLGTEPNGGGGGGNVPEPGVLLLMGAGLLGLGMARRRKSA